MRYTVATFILLLLFAFALHADKFSGPKPHKPAPPVDTTLVDSVQYWDEPIEVDTTQVDSTAVDTLQN